MCYKSSLIFTPKFASLLNKGISAGVLLSHKLMRKTFLYACCSDYIIIRNIHINLLWCFHNLNSFLCF